jgi:hypothetical protein
MYFRSSRSIIFTFHHIGLRPTAGLTTFSLRQFFHLEKIDRLEVHLNVFTFVQQDNMTEWILAKSDIADNENKAEER